MHVQNRSTVACMMISEFDAEDGPPGYVYVKMADHIEARIDAGQLQPGARLPAERDLATEYGVAVGTVRRATAELRDRGLVVTLPIKGTFVSREWTRRGTSGGGGAGR